MLILGDKRFASETSSQRSSTMTMRNYVDNKVDGQTSAAILNNAVRFSVQDNGGDRQWASLDRYGRRRRSRRMPFWAPGDLDDDGQQNYSCYNTVRTVYDEDPDSTAVGYPETASMTSVQAVVEEFDDWSTEQSPLDRRVSPLSQDTARTLADAIRYRQSTTSDRTKPATAELTLSWESPRVPESGVGSALAARASSEGDVLSGVEEAEAAAARRGSRLLRGASALFGRFVTETRQRLTTVSGAEWRRRCDVALRQQYSSSSSFHDASATSRNRGRFSVQSGTQTVAPTDDNGPAERSVTPRDVRLMSLFGSMDVDSNSSHRCSQRRIVNAPSSPIVASPAGSDRMAQDAPATWNQKVLQRTRSSKKRPTVRRYPSVERLDLPRRRATETMTATLDGGRSTLVTDRKRAERFRRQYVDVKLQRRAMPLERSTPTMKSMPTGVDVCGTTHHDDVVFPQLLRVPASADTMLS